ncbi:MAG: hypothetical protein Q8Q56_01700 [Alphaproteobacteria bacterium]|nr:hypothetical protein [Alphaproteobacteria bacterium]
MSMLYSLILCIYVGFTSITSGASEEASVTHYFPYSHSYFTYSMPNGSYSMRDGEVYKRSVLLFLDAEEHARISSLQELRENLPPIEQQLQTGEIGNEDKVITILFPIIDGILRGGVELERVDYTYAFFKRNFLLLSHHAIALYNASAHSAIHKMMSVKFLRDLFIFIGDYYIPQESVNALFSEEGDFFIEALLFDNRLVGKEVPLIRLLQCLYQHDVGCEKFAKLQTLMTANMKRFFEGRLAVPVKILLLMVLSDTMTEQHQEYINEFTATQRNVFLENYKGPLPSLGVTAGEFFSSIVQQLEALPELLSKEDSCLAVSSYFLQRTCSEERFSIIRQALIDARQESVVAISF